MAAVIRAPRLSAETVMLSVPGTQEFLRPEEKGQKGGGPSKPPLQPVGILPAVEPAIDGEVQQGVHAAELNALREQLISQETLAVQLRTELMEYAEGTKKKGYDDGYQAGLEAGRTTGEREFEQEIAVFKQTGTALKKSHDALLQEAENEMVAMVFEAVCKIVGEAVVSEQAARAALQALNKRREEAGILGVRFSRRDFDALSRYFDAHPGEKPAGIVISFDETIQIGGCMVETKSGVLNARMEDQLDQLKQLLLATRNEKN